MHQVGEKIETKYNTIEILYVTSEKDSTGEIVYFVKRTAKTMNKGRISFGAVTNKWLADRNL
ncbi:hypothetical protein PP175_25395 (plasmid) [Aneurinibacillus sp. Ricciae_BoGa-3]|uniref:hypothetical protein n=1 Tax=Aneurinibacillus sp. Ricciae_BoGa-3 TaxID=3022697 RepID=UPI0023424BC6|nr:hypothetical protein [Aneurinibacillus sp. Ricciae_BoGa-3]WCK57405.1 hypothetical protein PP175_25395 [Aneurinibacillus sp. Ricciae_BoGa-3]